MFSELFLILEISFIIFRAQRLNPDYFGIMEIIFTLDQARRPGQKNSLSVRCTACGNTFPIRSESNNSTDYHWENIADKLQYIKESMAKIKSILK
jgi:hypothetical protein